MARIRAIKPGFFKNESLAEFSFAHRILFAGLWTQADREGRLEDRPKRLKAELFPYDDGMDVGSMLQDLCVGGDPLIVRYVVDGRGYIWIRKFLEHQRPHHTEPPSTFPEPSQPLAPAPALSGVEPRENGATPLGREGKGKGNGVEEGKGSTALAAPLPRRLSPSDLSQAWNANRGALPACLELSDKRKREAQARIRGRPDLVEWVAIVRRIAHSDFCRGHNDRAWVATFDWLLRPDTASKVLEGKYDNRPRLRASGSRTGDSTDAAERYLRGEIGQEFEEGEVVDAGRSTEGGTHGEDCQGAPTALERKARKVV